MSDNPADLNLSNFLASEGGDPLQAPASFTKWMQAGAWAVKLYEPELLASADARTTISYNGKPRSVINLCSYNYLGLANHPEVVAAAQEALNDSRARGLRFSDAFRHDRSPPRTGATGRGIPRP